MKPHYSKFLLFIISVLFLLCCNKSNIFLYNDQQNKELITFIANSETMGNGIDSKTMDYFQGIKFPHLSLLIPYLQIHNKKFEVVDWQDKNVDWSKKDKIILGPVWGYTKKIDEFIAWLGLMEQKNLNIINHPKFLQWNLNKNYLSDLRKHKIAIPTTCIIDPTSSISLEEALELFQKKFGSSDNIIKGVIDAGGFGYMHINPNNLKEAKVHFDSLKSKNFGVIMQKFIPQIYKKGELSFVFLDNQLSHFFLKVPPYNEERVQAFYGGKSFHFSKTNITKQIDHIKSSFRKDLELSEGEVKNAYLQVQVKYSQLLKLLDMLKIPHPKYLRIDGVMVDSNFVIMELEGIEPYLEMQEATDNDPSNKILLLWDNILKVS